jgi:hypothetical protein
MSIEAMKQAVEAFEHIKKYVTDDGAMPENWDAYHEKEYFALEALRQAIEQAEKQEPKAWIYEGNLHIFDPTDWAIEPESVQPLYTAPNMSTKPENIDTSEERVHETDKSVHDDDIQEYKRPWIGMSDVEVATYSNVYCGISLARMIEALLKERNT